MSCTLNQITQWLALPSLQQHAVITGWSTDTRSLQPGDAFIAWIGPHHDGHQFLEEAVQKGASVLIVSQPFTHDTVPVIGVKDTYQAFWTLMRHWRQQYDTRVIAVTGSCGKTSTVAMIRQCLEAHYGSDQVLATEKNFNNTLGVAQTIARLRAHHQVAVVEVGIDRPGEMLIASRVVQPDIALLNNIAPCHLEQLGDEWGVAYEKGLLFHALMEKGVAIYDQSSPYRSAWLPLRPSMTHVSHTGEAAPVVCDVVATTASQTTLTCRYGPNASKQTITVPLVGKAMCQNLQAALTVAWSCDIPWSRLVTMLPTLQLPQGRMTWRKGPQQTRLLDDCYNANPQAMLAALEVIQTQPGPYVLIMGDLLGLGEQARAYHQRLAEVVAAMEWHAVYTVGPLASIIAKSCQGQAFETVDACLQQVTLPPQAAVLIKGSHAMRLDRLVKAWSS